MVVFYMFVQLGFSCVFGIPPLRWKVKVVKGALKVGVNAYMFSVRSVACNERY